MLDYLCGYRGWCRHLGLSNLLQSGVLWGNSAGRSGEILTSTLFYLFNNDLYTNYVHVLNVDNAETADNF